jgi:hypothetical protein
MSNPQDNNPKAADTQKGVEPCSIAENPCTTRTSDKHGENINFGNFHWGTIKSAFLGVAALVGASTLIFAMSQWIRGEIDKSIAAKFSDEKVLRQIAAQVRPALIFDANESITVDMGAAEYVKNIQIINRQTDGWPSGIKVDFNRYFANPPILTSIYIPTIIYPDRGKGLSWNFEVNEIFAHNEMGDSNRWVYRLELVP